MRQEELELLRAQIAEASEDGEAEPLELASLAGLLERLDPVEPTLSALRGALDVGPELLDAAEEALDQLLDVDVDDDEAESWDALCGLDELCAAATFLARAAELAEPVAEASRVVRAFPEAWTVHAEAATELLRDRAPRPGDPARQLWQAVEASRWTEAVAPQEDEEGASDATRRKLGLDVVISLTAWRRPSAELRLAAAGALPDAPPWRAMGAGPGWELALTEDGAGGPVLLISFDQGQFSRDGAPVSLTRTPDGWTCPALPGSWTVRIGAETLPFRIDP